MSKARKKATRGHSGSKELVNEPPQEENGLDPEQDTFQASLRRRGFKYALAVNPEATPETLRMGLEGIRKYIESESLEHRKELRGRFESKIKRSEVRLQLDSIATARKQYNQAKRNLDLEKKHLKEFGYSPDSPSLNINSFPPKSNPARKRGAPLSKVTQRALELKRLYPHKSAFAIARMLQMKFPRKDREKLRDQVRKALARHKKHA